MASRNGLTLLKNPFSIIGPTFDIKEALKSSKCVWKRDEKKWILPETMNEKEANDFFEEMKELLAETKVNEQKKVPEKRQRSEDKEKNNVPNKVIVISKEKDFKCIFCGGPVIPHPNRFKHPVTSMSFKCKKPGCDGEKSGLIGCCVCHETGCEWYWELDEISEDWYVCYEKHIGHETKEPKAYCQCCYVNSECRRYDESLG